MLDTRAISSRVGGPPEVRSPNARLGVCGLSNVNYPRPSCHKGSSKFVSRTLGVWTVPDSRMAYRMKWLRLQTPPHRLMQELHVAPHCTVRVALDTIRRSSL